LPSFLTTAPAAMARFWIILVTDVSAEVSMHLLSLYAPLHPLSLRPSHCAPLTCRVWFLPSFLTTAPAAVMLLTQ
jgi:hypothetical protein